MKINGQIFEVTNLPAFATSYLTNPAQPAANTFLPAANLRIHLASVIPALLIGFFPGLSLKTTSAADGRFGFSLTAAQLNQLKTNKRAYFLAYRKTGSVQVGFTSVDIFEPVYRCEAFDLTAFKPPALLKLYFAPYSVPNSAGISQATVDAQIQAAKARFKDISKLNATIQSGHISVNGSGRGADTKFKIDLGVSTSANLSAFIKGSVEDLKVDLPGPDFIVGICVSKDQIGKEVEKGIAGVMKDANKTIEQTVINKVAKQTGLPANTVGSLIKSLASITFRSLSYPVVAQKTFKVPGFQTLNIDVRAIVPKLAIGLPRKI